MPDQNFSNSASPASRIQIAGFDVPRMGFGAMRLPGVWDGKLQQPAASQVLERALDLGIRVIDTAWYYGDSVANSYIRKALSPYGDDLLLVTKLGYKLIPDGGLVPAVRRDEIRDGNERDRRGLGRDVISLTNLRWSGSQSEVEGIHFAQALDYLFELKSEGKVENVGLSNVTAAQLNDGLSIGPIASVSNAYSFHDQSDDELVETCTRLGIPYLPYFPLAAAQSAQNLQLNAASRRLGISVPALSLAWLLERSPVILPIPGTSRVDHLEANVAAASLKLDISGADEYLFS